MLLRHQNRQRQQRLLRSRPQHPVVDLQHIQRTGQHERVHDYRDNKHHHQKVRALAADIPDFLRAGLEMGGRAVGHLPSIVTVCIGRRNAECRYDNICGALGTPRLAPPIAGVHQTRVLLPFNCRS